MTKAGVMRLWSAVSLLWLLTLLCTTRRCIVNALEAKWTPESEEDNGPLLPLSTKQRMQLWKLDQAIQMSPNPENTLLQAAAGNDMPPEELDSLLRRNRQDIESVGGIDALKSQLMQQGQQPATPVAAKNTWKFLSSSVAVIVQLIRRHPRLALSLVLACLLISYSWHEIPRNGLVLSHGRQDIAGMVLSRGPTTLLIPPVSYVQEQLAALQLLSPWKDETENTTLLYETLKILQEETDVNEIRQEKIMLQEGEDADDEEESNDDIEQFDLQVTHHKNPTASSLLPFQRIITATVSLPVESIMMEDLDEEEDSNVGSLANLLLLQAWASVQTMQLTNAMSSTHRPSSRIRLISTLDSEQNDDLEEDEDEILAVLVLPGLGDWGRVALQPMCVSLLEKADNQEIRLLLTTLEGGHWRGHVALRISPTTTKSGKRSSGIQIQLSLLEATSGISRKWGERIVRELSTSIAMTVRQRALQFRARQAQSSRYQGAAQRRARYRRQTRMVKLQELEEMAVNRRRKWRRSGDAGRYRPSGDRMKSPKNAMY